MRHILVAGAVLLLAACAGQSDAITWYQSKTVYNTVVEDLAAARALGRIDDEQYNRIEVARSCAANSLDNMETAAFDTIPGNLPTSVIGTFNACLDDLIFANAQVTP